MLLRLGDAAVELMERHGSGVTIDAIAAAAGVSRRTVIRYVDLKEELVYVHPILWLDVFDQAIAEFADRPVPERLRIGSAALGRHIDADPEPVRRAFMVAVMNPDLAKGFTAVFQRWVERVAAEVLVGVDEPVAADRFRSRVVGASVMGTIDAVTREWLIAGGASTYSQLLADAHHILDPLLDRLDALDD